MAFDIPFFYRHFSLLALKDSQTQEVLDHKEASQMACCYQPSRKDRHNIKLLIIIQSLILFI